MAKKDILSDGVFMPTNVGANIYVWMAKDASKPRGDRACVITAHGMDIKSTEIVRAAHPKPDVELYFYCPHGFSLPDNSAEGVMTRTTKWYERVRAGNAKYDYTLTKAQGSHSAVDQHETYGHLQVGFHPRGRLERSFKLLMSETTSANQIRIPVVRDDMKANARNAFYSEVERMRPVALDVVTIRNRLGMFHGHVTLFSAIQTLEKQGFHYSEYHCNFCRGPTEGHSMKNNTESVVS